MDCEKHLALLEIRHEAALAFIEHMGLRLPYDEWMTKRKLASEFATQAPGEPLFRRLVDVLGKHRQ